MSKLMRAAAFVSWICIFYHAANAADSFAIGGKAQVREGDTWSPASVIGHEGRKYLVHYDGSDSSTDEWVTVDRLRKTGDASPLPVKPAATQPASAAFKVGDKIETKWGLLWRKSVVVRKQNDWTMVLYDNVWYEWVQPWRLRAVGSTQDTTEDSSPREYVKKGTPAPMLSTSTIRSGLRVSRLSNLS
jgi:hypothetical protein